MYLKVNNLFTNSTSRTSRSSLQHLMQKDSPPTGTCTVTARSLGDKTCVMQVQYIWYLE
jgi:hypothetical protein